MKRQYIHPSTEIHPVAIEPMMTNNSPTLTMGEGKGNLTPESKGDKDDDAFDDLW